MEPASVALVMTPWQQFGLVGLMAGAVLALLFFVIKWTLNTAQHIIQQAAEERKAWVKSLDDHTAQNREFSRSVVDAHGFQRKEHEKMIENLEEQGKVLARINGYRAGGG